MKKAWTIIRAFTALLFICFSLSGIAQTPTDGDYRSAASGNWSGTSSWQTRTGGNWVATSTPPSSSNNVYIQTGHVITVNVTAVAVNDLHVNTTGNLIIGGNTLTVSGKMRAYTGTSVITTGADGTFYSGQTNSASPGASSITSTGSGKLSVIGSTRNLNIAGEWGATTTGFAIEVNLTAGETATINASFKAASWNVISGTLNAVAATISADNGTTGGNITIANGATISSNRTGAQYVFQRTGTTNGATLTVNGTLRLTGTNPQVAMTTITLNGTVNLANAGAQNLNATATFPAGAALMNTFNDLILSGSGSKSLANTTGTTYTINGKMSLQGTATLSLGAATPANVLAYGASATLEYAGSALQTANANEWPTTAGPVNLIINNSSGFRMNLNRTLTGNCTLLAGDVQNSAGGSRMLTMAGSASALSVASGASISGTTGVELGLTISTGTTTLSGASASVTFASTTVSGPAKLILSRQLQIAATTVSSNINGILELANGGSVDLQNSAALIYGASSTLIYNNGNPVSAGGEWPVVAGPPRVTLLAAGTIVTLPGDRTVATTLTLTNGIINTSSSTLTVSNVSVLSVVRTNGYVNGNLERAVAAGASTVAFPVGDATAYSPVSLVFGAGNTAGNVKVRTDVPGAPAASGFAPAGSGISQTKYINRNWTLTSTISSASFAATFTYVNPGDVTGAANTSALIIGQNNGGTWSNPGVASSSAPAVTSVSGLNSFGTFSLGEDGCILPGIASVTALPAGPLCSGQTTNLTANDVAGINAIVTWWTGPGGTGSNLGTGVTLNAQPSGTYYARVTGDCGAPAEASITINSIGNTFSGTGNWTDGTKWSCGNPPGASDNITIASGSNVTLNTDFNVAGNFVMNATSSMSVSPDRTFSVSGSANFNGQSVTFKSDATGYGSLGQVTGTLTGASNVTVERFIPNVGFRSWRLLSVPTSGTQTIRQSWQENNAPLANNVPGFGTLITGGGNNTGASQALGFDFSGPNTSMLFWNNTTWGNVSGTLGALSAQQAYFLYVRGDRSKGVTGLVTDAGSTTLRSNGTIYTGTQLIQASNTFSLIPNLYPSAINFTGLTRSGVANNYTLWDSKTQFGNQLGRYVTFSGTNGWEPSIGTVSYPADVANTTIESGQAFFVNGGAGATITLFETAKTTASANGNLGLRPVKRTSLRTTLGNAEGELDGNVAVFDAAFSNTLDGDDAQKMGNPGANFGIEANGKLLSVEGRQPARAGESLQFRLWNLNIGSYTLKLEAGNIAEAGVEAVLEDSYTKEVTPLQLNGSTEISFTVSAEAASKAANRFRVLFRKGIRGIEAAPSITVFPNPVNGGKMNLQFKNQAAGVYQLRLLNGNGQALFNRVLNHAGGSAVQYVSLPEGTGSGIYSLEIQAPGSGKTVQAVLVNKK